MRGLVLWAVGAIAGGACVPVVAGLGGWGFGALLAGWVSMGFGFAAGACRPRAAAVLVALFTGVASAVNWAGTPAGWPGRSPGAFWLVWAALGVWSAGAMLGGMVLGSGARGGTRQHAEPGAAADRRRLNG